MANKIFGSEFADETNPIGTETVTIFNGTTHEDVTLRNLVYKIIANASEEFTVHDDDNLALLDSQSDPINEANRVEFSTIWTWISGKISTNIGAIITALTGKTTPVDADSIVISDSAAASASKKVVLSDLKTYIGTGVLSYSSISPTTGNVTAVVNTAYSADISGLTANRNFVVPAGSAGDIIRLYITAGDDTYALIIIGDTGVNVNGAGAATEWSRLFISGESVELECMATNVWRVKEDGRVPCKCQLSRTSAQTVNSGSNTKIEFDTSVFDVGNIGNITTDRITTRRASVYNIVGFVSFVGMDDQEGVVANVFQDGASILQMKNFTSNSGGNQTTRAATPPKAISVAAGAYFELYGFHEEGAATDTGMTGNSPYLQLIEQIP